MVLDSGKQPVKLVNVRGRVVGEEGIAWHGPAEAGKARCAD